MSRIVVPLDGSPLAETILPQVIAFARSTSANVTLLHVIPPLNTLAMNIIVPESWYDDQAAWSKNYLEDVARRFALEQGTQVEKQILDGDPASEIIDYVEHHIEGTLVAMATHGLSGAYRWVLGSVAAKILHSTSAPLLLLRPQKDQQTLPAIDHSTILVPLDGTPLAEQALKTAQEIAEQTHATLLLQHVIDNSQEQPDSGYLARIAQKLQDQGIAVQTQTSSGNTADEIARLSHEPPIGLVVMASHRRKGLERIALGSIAESVLQHTNVPVLLIEAREA